MKCRTWLGYNRCATADGPGSCLIHAYSQSSCVHQLLVSGLGRFKEGMALSEEEVAAFENYFYHITAARGSGEHALRHILKPFAWAHNPLEPQLQHLKVCS